MSALSTHFFCESNVITKTFFQTRSKVILPHALYRRVESVCVLLLNFGRWKMGSAYAKLLLILRLFLASCSHSQRIPGDAISHYSQASKFKHASCARILHNFYFLRPSKIKNKSTFYTIRWHPKCEFPMVISPNKRWKHWVHKSRIYDAAFHIYCNSVHQKCTSFVASHGFSSETYHF